MFTNCVVDVCPLNTTSSECKLKVFALGSANVVKARQLYSGCVVSSNTKVVSFTSDPCHCEQSATPKPRRPLEMLTPSYKSAIQILSSYFTWVERVLSTLTLN